MIPEWTIATLTSMMIWINAMTGLPIPSSPPEIVYTEAREMKYMLYGCNSKTHPRASQICKELKETGEITNDNTSTIGLYDHDEKVVHLNPIIRTYDKPTRDSVIIHELVHHMQFSANIPYQCFGQLEETAYDIQNKYIQKEGKKDIFTELNISPLYLFIIFSCDRGDIFFVPEEYDAETDEKN